MPKNYSTRTRQPPATTGKTGKGQPGTDILFVAKKREVPALPPETFRVGLVQMSMTSDPEHNLQHAIDRVREAAGRGAQIICLPELFQTQYFCQREDASLFDLAETIPGPTSNQLSRLASELQIVLIASLFEKRAAGVYHNT